MPRRAPVVREFRWLYVLPQILALLVCIVASIVTLGYPLGLFLGAGIYVTYSLASRAIFARNQRAGMRHFARDEWAEALPFFQRSQEFFERYSWLDRYRQVFLMSPSGASYHEMAILNQAACLVHLDRGGEAHTLYERVLELYPDSPVAEAALKTFAAARASD